MYICTHVHAPNPPYVYMYICMYGNTHTTISKNTSHKIEQNSSCILVFLNQARTGHRLVRAWFLRIAFVRELEYVCVCVCVSTPEAINN